MSHLWQQRPFRLVPQIFAYNGVKPDILGPPFNQSTGCCLVKDSGFRGQSKVTADWFCLMSSRTLWEEFSRSMHTYGRATMSVFITACQASSSHHCLLTLQDIIATTTPSILYSRYTLKNYRCFPGHYIWQSIIDINSLSYSKGKLFHNWSGR